MAKIRKMFTGGNTSKGFYSLHNNIISEDRNKLYILKGMPGGGKSSMMKDLGAKIFEKGYDIEFHHCPSDATSIDALVVEDLGVCILDGTPPHSMDPLYPGLTDETVDLARFIDGDKLKDKREDIIKAKRGNKNAYRKAFNYFRAAGNIYTEIEEANALLIDTEGVNKAFMGLMEKIFLKEPIYINSNIFKNRHLFSNANTPSGFVDYTDTIIEGVEDVYYISGDIGVGVSRLMTAICEKVSIMNYNVEIYHNSMMPDRIESVYIRNIDTMVTSNKCGIKYDRDYIDLNKYMNLEKINKDDYQVYDMLVKKGIDSLDGAKENHFILEKAYRPSIDYTGVDDVKARIWDEIVKKII